MNNDTATTNKNSKGSIEKLRIYQSARNLEDLVQDLARGLPESEYFKLADKLRRTSAACAHYINESHKAFSLTQKMEALHEARHAAEVAVRLLEDHEEQKYGKTGKVVEEYTSVIKQSWGLIKWIRARQEQQQAVDAIKAKDELVASRAN